MTDNTTHQDSEKPGRGISGVPGMLLVAGWALLLAGCESGTIGGTELRCESSGGLFASGEVSCAGSAERAGGSAGLDLADTDNVRGGQYRLEAVIAVERGAARATVEAADGDDVGGRVSPDGPLIIRRPWRWMTMRISPLRCASRARR